MKTNRGFTLIETIIYIGLFGIMIGGLFASVFQLMQNTQGIEEKVVIEEEVNFVMKKIDWLLNDLKTITTPVSGTSDTLEIINDDNQNISIRLDDSKIQICYNAIASCADEDFQNITSINVKSENLSFTYLESIDDSPVGINTKVTLNGRIVGLNKYQRP